MRGRRLTMSKSPSEKGGEGRKEMVILLEGS